MSILFTRMINKQLDKYQNSLLETHYSEVENMYKEMRTWKHDYRNHIQTLKSLVSSKDLDGISNYLDKLDKDLSLVDSSIKTGNKMADAILNSKVSLARSLYVPVDIEAQVSLALTTPEIDLCILIGNLFDNCIEANLLLPIDERMIRVYMAMKENQLYMSFTNKTASKKQIKKDNKFETIKGKGHGFGLVSIDNIIKRHDGYISRNSEDGAFTTEVLLPQ